MAGDSGFRTPEVKNFLQGKPAKRIRMHMLPPLCLLDAHGDPQPDESEAAGTEGVPPRKPE